MKSIKKVFFIIGLANKKSFFLLLILILIMALIDVLGVTSIFPFIGILIYPDLIQTNSVLNFIYTQSNKFGVTNVKQFLFLFGVAVFLLIVLSILTRAVTQYIQVRYSLMCEYIIGKLLIKNYLYQPYIWFLNQHSSNLSKNILSDVQKLTNGIITPVLIIIVQSIFIFLLATILILIEPLIALSAFLVLGFSYVVIFYSIKKIIFLISLKKNTADQQRFKNISEIFGYLREIKIGGLEKLFIDIFQKHSRIYQKSDSLVQIISHLPRYFIEMIAFGGMILIVLILMVRKNDFLTIIPIISLYAFAGYRFIPAFQQVYNSIVLTASSRLILNDLYDNLVKLKSKRIINSIGIMPFKKSITLNNVSFNYPGSKNAVIKNINLSIPIYSKIGIIGTSGAGKTTMIDLISGLIDPTEGTLKVDGNIINDRNKQRWQKNIGYVPQQIYLSDESIAANIALGVNQKNIDYKAVIEAAKIANIHDFVTQRLDKKYDTIVGERGARLSGGQRQRIAIARAFYHKPKVIIFDEATSSLDIHTEQLVMESVKNLKGKITIILISHRLTTVKNFDIIYVLENGRLKKKAK
jgi:ABC-type multidrug transport system fused ATPase/permease subunit